MKLRGGGVLAETEVIANTIAWDNLADNTKRRRLQDAARYMREHALPFLRKCVHPMDDDGAPLSDNFLISEVLRYGVRDAYKKNRISPTLSFPEMLPNYVVDEITARARGELRRNARCGSRPCPIGSRYTRRAGRRYTGSCDAFCRTG
jgi:hypothetical protein